MLPIAFTAEKSLGQLILSHLRKTTATGAWLDEDLGHIQHFLAHIQSIQAIPGKANPAETALRAWIASLPQPDCVHIQAVLPKDTRMFLGTLLPAVLVWAREQPWGQTINMIDAPTVGLIQSTTSTQPKKAQLLALQAMSAIVRDVIIDVKESQDAWNYVGPWVLATGHSLWPNSADLWEREEANCDLYFDIWLAIGIAAENADKKRLPDEKSTLLTDRWKSSFAKVRIQLSPEQEARLFKKIVTSELSATFKLHLCHGAAVTTLAQEDVHHFMESQLPPDEASRLALLPWNNSAGRFNAEVARLYVPHIAALVDMFGPPFVWSNVTKSLALLRELANTLPVSPLVGMAPDIFDEPTP